METERIEKYGEILFHQSLTPYKRVRYKKALIFGLDSEYRSVPDNEYPDQFKHELICYQLAYNDYAEVYTDDFTWENVAKHSFEILKKLKVSYSDYNHIYYAVFFAVAENQFLGKDLLSKMYCYNAHSINLEYKYNNYTLSTFDVSLWFPNTSLRESAKTFGLTKLEYDVTNLTSENLNDSKFLEYAKNDAIITGKLLQRLRDSIHDISNIDILTTVTPANTSAVCFRHKYIDDKYGQRDMRIRRLSLKAAWGGTRIMYFRGQKENAYEYDAKSFYPNCVVNLKLLPLETDWKYTSNLDDWLSGLGGFGHVVFEFPAGTKYPCLPVKSNGVLQYPLRGSAYCTTWEVKVALDMGASVTLIEGAYYDRGVTWLADYESNLIKSRDQARDPSIRHIYKMMANGIIGKLFEKRIVYDRKSVIEYAEEYGFEIEDVYNILGDDRIKKIAKVGNLYYPEWYALILGYARAIIAKATLQYKPLNVMTDAIIVGHDYGESITIDNIQFTKVTSGKYVGYREGIYAIGEKISHAYLSYDTAKELLKEYKSIEKIKDKRKGIITLLQSLNGQGKWGNDYTIERIVSILSDKKRIFLSDGDSIPPNKAMADLPLFTT